MSPAADGSASEEENCPLPPPPAKSSELAENVVSEQPAPDCSSSALATMVPEGAHVAGPADAPEPVPHTESRPESTDASTMESSGWSRAESHMDVCA